MTNRFKFNAFIFLVQIFEDVYSDLFFLDSSGGLDIFFFAMALLQFGRIIARDLGWFESAWNHLLEWSDPSRKESFTPREMLRKRLYHNRKYLLFSFTDLLTEYFSVIIVVCMAIVDYYWKGQYCSIACGIQSDEQMSNVLISYSILFCGKLIANWIVHRVSSKTTLALQHEVMAQHRADQTQTTDVNPPNQHSGEEELHELSVIHDSKHLTINDDDFDWSSISADLRSFSDFEASIPGLESLSLTQQVNRVRDHFLGSKEHLTYFILCTGMAVTSGIWASARK
eukprot:TRINITY_DN4462_c0_g1_i2.p1 TRINITY_DN4462_c0_g1~~TRINITY_DN4462_c0_g1_i2.p1  ORF type:complete len:310 (-),score=79.01 TRINITY_DN4462_c0_g1_i2:352-1203(-)